MIEASKLSCAYTSKTLRSVADPWPNTAKKRPGDPSASGTESRVSIFGFITTRCDPWGEGKTDGDAIAEGSVDDDWNLRAVAEEEGGKLFRFISSG